MLWSIRADSGTVDKGLMEDDEAYQEKELYRQREFDEFKDGSNNIFGVFYIYSCLLFFIAQRMQRDRGIRTTEARACKTG